MLWKIKIFSASGSHRYTDTYEGTYEEAESYANTIIKHTKVWHSYELTDITPTKSNPLRLVKKHKPSCSRDNIHRKSDGTFCKECGAWYPIGSKEYYIEYYLHEEISILLNNIGVVFSKFRTPKEISEVYGSILSWDKCPRTPKKIEKKIKESLDILELSEKKIEEAIEEYLKYKEYATLVRGRAYSPTK